MRPYSPLCDNIHDISENYIEQVSVNTAKPAGAATGRAKRQARFTYFGLVFRNAKSLEIRASSNLCSNNILDEWKEVGMTNPRYLGLRIVLFIFFIVIAASGVLMILGGKTLVMWAFMHPPEREVSNLFMMMLKQMGGILLMLSLMLYFAF